MKTRRLILTLLALIFAFAPQSLTTSSAARKRDYTANLISPRAGDVLIPGQVVRIQWTAVFPNVDVTACETEILLSLDGGRTFTSMIAEVRDPRVQYLNWTVPKTPTQRAVLDIRFGCLPVYPETPSPQVHSTFVISAMN
jgi:hypothetical protein